jgi:uroporphyrinogen-III decarboxylase
MKGIFLDLRRQPEQLLKAQEKAIRIQVEYAIHFKEATGLTWTSIPLHRGSDGMMSIAQFEKHYWPQLKDMLLQLIDAGITPNVFYEGAWDQRLEYLAELPRGKTTGMFQSSDIFRVKEVLGDTMAILGGMPTSLLRAGPASAIRERTHEVCERVGKGGGFVMQPTINEMEGGDPELISAWIAATKEFGVYAD